MIAAGEAKTQAGIVAAEGATSVAADNPQSAIHNPQSQSPPTLLGPIDLGAAWASLIASVQDKPALSWLRALSLRRFDGRTAVVAPLPGHADIRRFVADRQRDQLARLLAPLLGQAVRVELEGPSPRPDEPMSDAAPPEAAAPASRGTQGAAPPPVHGADSAGGAAAQGANANTNPSAAPRATSPPPGNPPQRGPAPRYAASRADREYAMALPLVREVMQIFETTLIETRPQQQAAPKPVDMDAPAPAPAGADAAPARFLPPPGADASDLLDPSDDQADTDPF